jgi:hypothetical protein
MKAREAAMTRVKIIFCTVLLLIHIGKIQAHVFNLYADTNEEIKDSIIIRISPDRIVIGIESIYNGQIAPHIRFMADNDGNKRLDSKEINAFFKEYESELINSLQEFPITLNEEALAITVTSVYAPAIGSDDFVTELSIKTNVSITGFTLARGRHRLIIDPRLFFQIGNQFIDMAKEKAAFTDQQENAIARFLQVNLVGEKNVCFESAYPGYIDAQKKTIFGIFYDQTAIRVQFLPYTQLKTELKVE